MRAFLWVASFTFVAIGVSVLPLACNQDAAASNEERDTHMGNIRAVAPPAMGQGMPVGAPSALPSPTIAPQAASSARVGPAPASASVSASASQLAPQAPLIQKKP